MLQLCALRAPPASNAVAALVAGTAATVGTVAPIGLAGAAASYLTFSTAAYCLRRGILHSWPDGGSKLGAGEVLRRHLAYESGWHLDHGSELRGRLTHAGHVLCWLLLFQPLYPVLEACLFPLDKAAFWFYYPRARGGGLVIDSRALRRSGKRGNGAQVFRLDWHRFDINVGRAYPPPHTGRYPPKVSLNLPHVDLPQAGVRHWPWRQHTDAVMRLMPRSARETAREANDEGASGVQARRARGQRASGSGSEAR